MEDPAIYQLALTRIPGIGPVYTKLLIGHFGDAASVFHADKPALDRTGLNKNLVDAILQFSAYAPLQNELQTLRRNGIRLLFFTDPDYPRRLLTLPKPPALLFYQGVADLNTEKIVSVVGTRRPTDYGKQMTERLIRELAQPNLLIISGLAFGIDAAAHTAALEYRIPTIGVLAHGFEYLYPPEHTALSRTMRRQGGLLTPFAHDTKTNIHSFAIRNRLIAGLCDALIIVQTGDTGGSLITAGEALTFSKKIFAVPGRITDEKSQGCLRLIRGGQAELLTSAEQLQASMGWKWPAGRHGQQATLRFPSKDAPSPAPGASPEQSSPEQPSPEQNILVLLRTKETLSIDELSTLSRLNIASAIRN